MSDQQPGPTFTLHDNRCAVRLPCAVVLIRNDTLLLIHRTDDPPRSAGGDWVPPGGSPPAGESTQACAIWDSAEETAIAVQSAAACWSTRSELRRHFRGWLSSSSLPPPVRTHSRKRWKRIGMPHLSRSSR